MSTEHYPVIIGLTGGIASGKSTVSRMFHAFGATIIDADIIARDVVAPGTEGLQAVVDTFGNEILIEGELNRAKLGEVIFGDDEARKTLNGILHPLVAQGMLAAALQASGAGDSWVIYDAALIVENGLQDAFAGLIVVACDIDTQIERIVRRDGLTIDAAKQRVAAQFPLEKKIAVADWVIDNDQSLELTRAQVEVVYNELETLYGSPL